VTFGYDNAIFGDLNTLEVWSGRGLWYGQADRCPADGPPGDPRSAEGRCWVPQIAITDVRDWIETLEGDGLVNVAKITSGLSASITAQGRLALGQFRPLQTTQNKFVGSVEHLAPVVGAFQGTADHSTLIRIKDGLGQLRTVAINLIIDVPREVARHYDYQIVFDLTNVSEFDLKVTRIFFKTLEWRPLEKIERYMPLAGLGDEKNYFCLIDKHLKEYDCRFAAPAPWKFVLLHPRELDTFRIGVNAMTEGVYSGELLLDYSVAGKVGRIVVGRVSDVRFVDRENAFSAPRE
jgi:hypothetical protein